MLKASHLIFLQRWKEWFRKFIVSSVRFFGRRYLHSKVAHHRKISVLPNFCQSEVINYVLNMIDRNKNLDVLKILHLENCFTELPSYWSQEFEKKIIHFQKYLRIWQRKHQSKSVRHLRGGVCKIPVTVF